MSSRSKNGHRRNANKRVEYDKILNFEFWQRALTAIEAAEKDPTSLSWNSRSLLVTRLGGRLPDLCERHGLGVPDGYVAAIAQLVSCKPLEWFESDAIKRLKKLLSAIIGEAQVIRSRAAHVDAVGLPRGM